MAAAFRQVGLPWAQFIISVGALTGITSVLLVLMLSQPRVLLAMARDRLLPPGFFGAVHPRFRTPWKSTILTGLVVCLMAGLLPLRFLMELVNIGTLLAFAIVCAAVLIMRRTHPAAERPFRAPLVPLVPILGILMCLLLMFSLPWENWLRLGVWLLLGFVIYFGYGRRRSSAQPAERRGRRYLRAEGSSHPEVRPAHLVALLQLTGGGVQGDTPDLKHVAVMRGLQRHVRVLLDEQDRRAGRVDLADDLEDRLHDLRRQAQRRLVQQQQPRPGQQRPRNRQHLLLAAGERRGALTQPFAQPREQRQGPLAVLGDAGPVGAGIRPDLQVLLNGEVREQPAALGGLRDAQTHDLVRRLADQRLAVEDQRPGGRAQQSGDRAQRRGFAGPVGADQRHDLPGLDGQVDPLQRVDRAVVDVQVMNLKERAHFIAFDVGHGGRRYIVATPRYASITFGSRCISAGVPTAMVTP